MSTHPSNSGVIITHRPSVSEEVSGALCRVVSIFDGDVDETFPGLDLNSGLAALLA